MAPLIPLKAILFAQAAKKEREALGSGSGSSSSSGDDGSSTATSGSPTVSGSSTVSGSGSTVSDGTVSCSGSSLSAGFRPLQLPDVILVIVGGIAGFASGLLVSRAPVCVGHPILSILAGPSQLTGACTGTVYRVPCTVYRAAALCTASMSTTLLCISPMGSTGWCTVPMTVLCNQNNINTLIIP